MNVWCRLPTIFKQRQTLLIACLFMLCVALITMLLFTTTSRAAPGINQTISFQGRVLTNSGTPVPEGYYNIQFKIYKGGSGTTANNPDGTLAWTETYINNGGNNAVYIKNGYLSVDLGSLNAFGTSIDWNDDTLWLSMNIAGSSPSCTTFGSGSCLADGEMTPMKRLTASPYALNSQKLGGIGADGFIKNSTVEQTADFTISGTGKANSLQGSTSVLAPLFDRATSGELTIGSTNATAITIGSSSSNQDVAIGNGTGVNSVRIGSTSGASSLLLQGGSNGVEIASANGLTIHDTNSSTDVFTINANGDVVTAGGIATSSTINTTGDIKAQSSDLLNDIRIGWNDTTSTGYLQSTSNSIALQGGGNDLIIAKNNAGQANIGIGNSASAGYALDVTGSTNVSGDYAINGVSILSDTNLNFAGTATSVISAATSQVLQLSSDSSVRIGSGVNDGAPTLLTLDKYNTTPSQTGDAVLGSMYYDTTLGKVQCFEADGWGACSSSPDNFVTLSPEYSNSVTSSTGIGSFTSDICSDTLNINDGSSGQPTICGSNETYNLYKWTTNETNSQTKDIFVTYQLPSNFTGFVAGSTSLAGRTDDSAASVSYQIYKNTSSGLVACGTSIAVSSGVKTEWQKATASGSADPANCNINAGDSIVFKISLTSQYTTQQTNAYVSTLNFAFSND